MKTAKLVTGILSIILFVFVTFQSCAAGIGNSLEDNGEVSGSAGLIVAVCLLVGGIVSIATRSKGKGGSIACAIVYAVGAVFAFVLAGSFTDLNIWGGYAVICAILHIASIVKAKKQ